MEEATKNFWHSCPEAKARVTTLIERILKNIIENPVEKRWRSLRKTKVCARLKEAPQSFELLLLLGFCETETHFVLPDDADVGMLKLVLDELIKLQEKEASSVLQKVILMNESDMVGTNILTKPKKIKTREQQKELACGRCGIGHDDLHCPKRLADMKQRCSCGSRKHNSAEHLCICGQLGHFPNSCPIMAELSRRWSQEDRYPQHNVDDEWPDMSYESILELQDRIGVVNVGLTSGELLRLGSFSYDCSSLKSPLEIDDCKICLCPFDPGELCRRIPYCTHFFHETCIDQWLEKNNSCPLCRCPVREGKINPLVPSIE